MADEKLNNSEKVEEKSNFIKDIIDDDLQTGKHDFIVTRFPPEPNGYLHIGHAKSICLNFGVADKYNGRCHLRFDDTNPEKEDDEYINSIQEDVKWLGFDWKEHLFFASDYYDKLYNYAIKLIKDGKAYVDSQSSDEIRQSRGTAKGSGTESPYRNRTVEENLELFEQMKNGKFEEGEHVLRAKIDMSHPNVIMRDPAMYRIKYFHHHRTGDKWCVYPMYDFAHGISDAIEGITHSLCTLEFEVHRPLYEWFNREVETPTQPRQIEFAKLKIGYTVVSKRRLIQLVKEGYVDGWDDPRMPTIAGIRRRGYTPESIRDFAERVGVAKRDSIVDLALLEHCVREDLNKRANRYMGVINPLKLVITNYPEGQTEEFNPLNNPEDESKGTRKVPFSKVLYVEKDDFEEIPPRKWRRLTLGKEVRLRSAYYITCNDVIKDENGEVTEIHCTYDPETKGGWSEDGRKVKGTIHWVSAEHAIPSEVRLYEPLYTVENPLEGDRDFKDYINPDSLKVVTAFAERNLAEVPIGEKFQFERVGYFSVDYDSTPEKLVLNRIVTLKDRFAKKKK